MNALACGHSMLPVRRELLPIKFPVHTFTAVQSEQRSDIAVPRLTRTRYFSLTAPRSHPGSGCDRLGSFYLCSSELSKSPRAEQMIWNSRGHPHHAWFATLLALSRCRVLSGVVKEFALLLSNIFSKAFSYAPAYASFRRPAPLQMK
jgi:hypothetical protein